MCPEPGPARGAAGTYWIISGTSVSLIGPSPTGKVDGSFLSQGSGFVWSGLERERLLETFPDARLRRGFL